MILDNEEHRTFLLGAISSAQASGPISELEKLVAIARGVREAVESATIAPSARELAGDNLHN